MGAGKCVSEPWRTGKAPHFCGLKEIGSYKGTRSLEKKVKDDQGHGPQSCSDQKSLTLGASSGHWHK